jgi:hypothetical protein
MGMWRGASRAARGLLRRGVREPTGGIANATAEVLGAGGDMAARAGGGRTTTQLGLHGGARRHRLVPPLAPSAIGTVRCSTLLGVRRRFAGPSLARGGCLGWWVSTRPAGNAPAGRGCTNTRVRTCVAVLPVWRSADDVRVTGMRLQRAAGVDWGDDSRPRRHSRAATATPLNTRLAHVHGYRSAAASLVVSS